MAKKSIEFNASLKDLSVADLQAKLTDEKLRLKKLEFAHAISPLESPMAIRNLRRDIARTATALKTKRS